MVTVRHPRAREDVPGHPPSRVTVAGDTYPVEDGSVDLPSQQAVADLARAYDLTADDLTESSDAETCQATKADGETCGRELPCPYHDDGGDD